MENDEGIEKLYFELASESRLNILRELRGESLRMQEIARRLDMTATEVFRQLQRLSGVFLVHRQPEGTFTITQYGRLVLHLSSSLEFISKHRDFFMNHDVWRLPIQFVDRMGELSQTNLVMDSVDSINRCVQVFLEAEKYAWGLSEHGRGPEHVNPQMIERIHEGVKVKLLIPEKYLSTETQHTDLKNVEMRGLPEIPAVMVISENEAAVCFRFIGGRLDYAGFFGKDPAFLGWARDLFQHYWDMGKGV